MKNDTVVMFDFADRLRDWRQIGDELEVLAEQKKLREEVVLRKHVEVLEPIKKKIEIMAEKM